MKVVAFIPLRGGSKSIPGKNTRPLAGKPLCHWVIEAAQGSAAIDTVIVSTDSPAIRASVESLHLDKVRVINRSAATATDTASTESAMLEFAREHTFDQIVLIQATSPLLSTADLDQALAAFNRQKADSLVTVVPQKRFTWSLEGDVARPINYDFAKRPRRQDFAPYYVENGAFYISSRQGLLDYECRLFGKVAAHVMPEETFHELDEPADWIAIETFLKDRQNRTLTDDLHRRASRIKLFLTDVDVVLTDAGMYYTENGDELKKFNTRDGKGIELLRNAGIQTGIITTENTKIVERRAAKLKMNHLIQGAHDKIPAFEEILKKTGFRADEVAYIGDDLADIPVLQIAGFSACPGDAISEVKECVHFQCKTQGGKGAVREFAEIILSNRAE